MIYTPLTKRAAEIAYNAHMGQRDKAGMPYIFHSYHVAEQMKDEMTVCAALLHDVAEDTAVTLEELAKEFPPQVIEALRLLTHDPKDEYMDYVAKIKGNPIARAVKIEDLKHNSDISRMSKDSPLYERALALRKKYAAALALLEE
ncbi:MAG TPA: HD domain-containing protein [Candidatus Borkfalkia excrementigallinarum]|uniref:HD domain-containing protein n=1 Tax=Candidatus Borkfalkia excrementigallinarum TaxID=2838506 RepID=A0A9D1ZVQ3_9FIRM|nr:HD domain-containing protein [Candidatus Borkfalkia excrementigallinarum]